MSIDRRMDTEIVVRIYNGILLSHKKEHIWVRPNEVDEPRATIQTKSERERQILYIYIVHTRAKSLQLCMSLCDAMGCSPSGSSVHCTLQARRLQWVSMPFSRGSSRPRDRTHISCMSCIAGRFLPTEPPPQETMCSLSNLFQIGLYSAPRSPWSLSASSTLSYKMTPQGYE